VRATFGDLDNLQIVRGKCAFVDRVLRASYNRTRIYADIDYHEIVA
jgi:hypothetical protein